MLGGPELYFLCSQTEAGSGGGTTIELQLCLAVPLIPVWKASVPSLCPQYCVLISNTDRQHPIDVLHVACG